MKSARSAAQIALATLALVSGCAVTALSSFDDPRWYANGWTQLMLLAASWFMASRLLAVAAIWGSERLKACCIYSMALHVVFAATLKQISLNAPHVTDDPPTVAETDHFADEEWLAEVSLPEADLSPDASPIDAPIATDDAEASVAEQLATTRASADLQQRFSQVEPETADMPTAGLA